MASHRRKSWRKNCQLGGELLESRRVLASLVGTVFEDSNSDGSGDTSEPGLGGVVVFLDDNGNGALDQRGFGLEPDVFVAGQVLNNAERSIVASAALVNNEPAFRVFARFHPRASTGELVFGQKDATTWDITRRLRFDFASPADSVSLDVVGATVAKSSIALDAFGTDGTLLERTMVNNLGNAIYDRLSIERSEKDIAYVVAHVTTDRSLVRFDNLRVDDAGSEMATLTNGSGFYRFTNVPPGKRFVAQQVPDGFEQTSPFPNLEHEVSFGASIAGIAFGNHTSSLRGTAFEDLGAVGVYEPAGPDLPLHGAALYLDLNANGLPDPLELEIDPNDFVANEVLDRVSTEVTLSVVDADGQRVDEMVTATSDSVADLGGKVFGHEGATEWSNDRRLRVDLLTPSSSVQLDFVGGAENGQQRGAMEVFDVLGESIATVTTDLLGYGQRQTMTIQRAGHDIGFVVAYTIDSEEGAGRLDNLRASGVSEPVAVANEDGDYEFTPLAEGTYRVGALTVPGRSVSLPAGAFYDQEATFGETVDDLNFGFVITNTPPAAQSDSAVTQEDNAITIDVLFNDTDDGTLNPATVSLVENPANGTAVVELNGQISYTPLVDFHGPDIFIYTVQDDRGIESNQAVVTIRVDPVNDAPIAREDAATVLAGDSTVIGVLDNDTDVDSQLVKESLRITQPPNNGTAQVDMTTGTITYTPKLGFTGPDALHYTVEDTEGAESNKVAVQIKVVDEGTPPVAADDTATTEGGVPVAIAILLNDMDDDGTIDPASVVITQLPAHGQVTIDRSSGQAEYLPASDFVGDDSFRYIVRDDMGFGSNEALVTVSVSAATAPFQNAADPLDIDDDEAITPRDALLIINELNGRRISDPVTGKILADPTLDPPTAFVDVNGDGFVTAGDAIQVINFLNSQSAAASQAEGEPLDPASVAVAFAAEEDEEDQHDDLWLQLI